MKSLKNTNVKGAEAASAAASATEFSTQNMLRDIKKVIKSFGSGIMKRLKGTNEDDELDLTAFPSDKLLFDESCMVAMDANTEIDTDLEPDKESDQSGGDFATKSKHALDKLTTTDKTQTKKAAKVKLQVNPEKQDDSSEVLSPSESDKNGAKQHSGTSSKENPGSVRLIFSNVDATEEVFKNLLNNHSSSCGKYEKCYLPSRGKAVVIVTNDDVANSYISHFNGYELNGNAISVSRSALGTKETSKKAYMPSKELFKSLVLLNVPKNAEQASLEKAISTVSGAVYKSLQKVEDGKWKVSFENVPDCIKFNSLLNGCTLTFIVNEKSKKAKLKCEAPSFGQKASHAGRVFVQNLPFNTTAKQLENLAHSFDKRATIHMPHGGKKGFAFIQFSNIQVAEKAIGRLNGTEFKGRTIRLTLALPTELYSDKPKETGNAVDNDDQDDKPVSVVESDHDEEDANTVSDDDTPADEQASMETSHKKQDSKIPNKADEHLRTIFVRNLSFDSTEAGLQEYFSTFGAVDSCKICKAANGTSKGTAFILFRNVEDARKVLEMEQLALERDTEFDSAGTNDTKKAVKRSQAAGLGFSLNGRRLRLSKAISREEANKLAKTRQKPSEDVPDKKHNDLLMEGVIAESSPEFQKLTPMQKKLQIASLKEKLEKMKNPNMFINPKRLCVRNLPNNVDVNELRRAIATHFRKNVDLKRICGTSKVDASRTIGKVTVLSDEKRKVISGDTVMRRRKPFAFIDFDNEELALCALRYLSNNSELFGQRNCLFAEFAIEDSRALYIQRKRKEQYQAKLKEKQGDAGQEPVGKRKKRKTYSRGQKQRMKRRKLLEAANAEPASATSQ
ncbi:RNA binding protein protein [Babesia ovis]|uniref:RNA binding protein protein n=1 Tax=Babesia ovis TaxID=5869 RepID=A0A9W5WWD1_BABOV|nr:RNA binding protein protein [Babesia ovis]